LEQIRSKHLLVKCKYVHILSVRENHQLTGDKKKPRISVERDCRTRFQVGYKCHGHRGGATGVFFRQFTIQEVPAALLQKASFLTSH
jgi:hypothetical protein